MDRDLEIKASRPGGTKCPCCDKHAQIYKRKFLRSMAIELINILPYYTMNPGMPLAINRYLVQRGIFHGSYSKLCFWGLLKQDTAQLAGKKHSGLYSITDKGILFAKNEVTIPEYVIEYNKSVIRFEGDDISIRHTFKNLFDYDELMNEVYQYAAAY